LFAISDVYPIIVRIIGSWVIVEKLEKEKERKEEAAEAE
jgi:hypothetical protein